MVHIVMACVAMALPFLRTCVGVADGCHVGAALSLPAVHARNLGVISDEFAIATVSPPRMPPLPMKVNSSSASQIRNDKDRNSLPLGHGQWDCEQ